jgi:hypothetical protein
MSDDTPDLMSVLKRVLEVATLAGIKGKINEEDQRFEACYEFEDRRTQMVYARPIRTPGGPGICVFSPATRYKKGFFGGPGKKEAQALLLRNEDLTFARYGLRDYGEGLLLVASVDLLLETMDPEELRAAMGSTSAAADTWEERSGTDNF